MAQPERLNNILQDMITWVVWYVWNRFAGGETSLMVISKDILGEEMDFVTLLESMYI